MSHYTINLCIVIVFLLLNLAVGFWKGRNIQDMRDYAIANRSYGVGALVMTYLATLIGSGSIFRASNEVYKDGILPFIAILGVSFSFIVMAIFIAPKIQYFKGCLTVGDMLGKIYGDRVKKFTGVISVLVGLVIMTMQISAIGLICDKFFGIDRHIAIVMGGICVVLYSSFGGMRAVAATDILQFLMIALCIVILSNVVVAIAGGTSNILMSIPKNKLQIISNPSFTNYFSVFLLWGVFLADMHIPANVQRMLMAKNTKSLKSMFFYVGFADMSIRIMVALIGISAIVLYPNSGENEIISKIYHDFLHHSIQPVVVIGLLAIVLSSADSHMHAAGVSFTNDLVIPFLEKSNKKFNSVKIAIYSTLILGIIGIFLSLMDYSLAKLMFLRLQIVAPAITCPLLFGILGLKSNEKSFFVALIISIISFTICIFVVPEHMPYLSALITTTINGLTLLVCHLFFYKKFVIENRGYESSFLSNLDFFSIKNLWTKLISIPYNYIENCKIQLVNSNNPCVLFGVGYMIYLIVPIFLLNEGMTHLTFEILCIKIFAIIICCLLITNGIWNDKLKPFFPIFWQIAITYCLPFFGAIMFLLTNSGVQWLTIIAINIILMMLLVDWKNFFINTIVGIISAVLVAKNVFHHKIELNISFDNGHLIFYQVFFGTIIGLLFARKKQIKTEELESGNKSARELYELAKERLNYNELGSLRVSQSLSEANMGIIKKMDSVRKAIEHGDTDVAEEYLDILESDIVNVLVTEENCIKLHAEEIELKDLVSSLDALCRNNFGYDVHINLRTKSSIIECDKMAFYRIISQAIEDLKIELSLGGRKLSEITISIDIADTRLQYSLSSIKEYHRSIGAIRFAISTADSVDHSIFKEEYKRQLVDVFKLPPSNKETSEKIATSNYLEAHYGLFENIKSDQDITKIYVLPQNLYEIRPKGLDIYVPEDILISWPEALDRELKLKHELTVVAPTVEWENVQKALNFIKRYHAHQIGDCGEPYYLHPIAVARIMLGMLKHLSEVNSKFHDNQEAIVIASLLHGILENTATNPTIVESMFGQDVVKYVLEITKISCNESSDNATAQETLKNLLSNASVPVCIKIADRLHNIYTIDSNPDEKQRVEMARETLDFFITPAKNLGFDGIAEDLEKASNHIIKYGKLDDFEFRSDAMAFLKFQWSFIKNS